MKTLEKLWFGNICPYEKHIRKGSDFENLVRLIFKNEEKLNETLTESQKETFEKFKDCQCEMTDISEREAFVSGFRLGAKIIIEVLTDADKQLDDIGDL